MLSYLAFVMRYLNNAGESDVTYGETLVTNALRILQDCPASGMSLRKVGNLALLIEAS